MHEEYMSGYVLHENIDKEIESNVWIDRWDNKEYTRPDVLDFTFNTSGDAGILSNGTVVFSWAQFNPTSDTSGEMQTVACSTEIGNPENFEVYNFVGTSGWTDNDVTGQTLSELKESERLADDDDSAFRESYNEWDYESQQWTDEEGTTTTWSPCKVSLDLPKIGRDDSMFTEYSVTTGMRIYNTEDNTFETVISDTSFTYTLEAPTYEFGDEYEFDERPYDEAIFTTSNAFEISDYISDADGVGYQVVQGLFKAIPNFQTTMWMFKFNLEMPAEYFDDTSYLYQWGTYQDANQELDEVTIACGITIGDPDTVEVFEYDDTFDSTADLNLPPWEGNYNALSNDPAYMKSPEREEMELIASINGKARQACNVRVEIPPAEASTFFDKDYTLTVGGRLYESRESTTYHELPPLEFSFYVPAADFEFEPYEEIIMDTQIVAEEEFGVDGLDYLGVDTEVKQHFYAGFETNPYEETVNDFLGFQFELEAGNEVFKTGGVVYQWATYVKSDDFSTDPITVGCATTVGDPYTAETQTFSGTNSMSADGANVANRTVSQQNVEEKAQIKDSFGTTQELEWYTNYNISDTTSIQPCRAVIEYDGKLDSTNAIFGVYNVTLGSRLYANSTDTAPAALPDQSF